MKILVFTPIWKRPEITEVYCLGILRLKQKFNIDAFCVISPEDDSHNRLLLEKYGIEYCEFRNKLGAKKNFGLNEAMKKDFDYLMELNSDDIVKDELIETYLDLMEGGEDFIGLGNFVFYDSNSGKSKECTSTTLFGIGRAYKKSMLENEACKVLVECTESYGDEKVYYKRGNRYWIHPADMKHCHLLLSDVEYRLWDDQADRGMDNYSQNVLKSRGVLPKVVRTEEPLAFDVKSETNLWKYDEMPGQSYLTGKLFIGLSENEKNVLNALRKNH